MIAELTNHIWQSTVFAILVGLITLAFHRKPGSGPLLVVAKRVVEIPPPVLVINDLRPSAGAGLGHPQHRAGASRQACSGAIDPAISRNAAAGTLHASRSRLDHYRHLRLMGMWIRRAYSAASSRLALYSGGGTFQQSRSMFWEQCRFALRPACLNPE
jgi:hypothetical protein